jgi:Myristoyl-CoA:protein N-myristoyltransferase, C-terminal domain
VTLEITDYVSFYTLPSAILQAGTKYSTLDAAYLFYYASDVAFKPNGESLLKKRLGELVTDAMIIAVQVGSLYGTPNSPHSPYCPRQNSMYSTLSLLWITLYFFQNSGYVRWEPLGNVPDVVLVWIRGWAIELLSLQLADRTIGRDGICWRHAYGQRCRRSHAIV